MPVGWYGAKAGSSTSKMAEEDGRLLKMEMAF